jgi:hypothetical protein
VRPVEKSSVTQTRKLTHALRTMYIIKVKGKAKIPDYIQLRDEAFVLIAYFRADRPLKDLHRYGLEGKEVELAAVIADLEFGKLRPLSI